MARKLKLDAFVKRGNVRSTTPFYQHIVHPNIRRYSPSITGDYVLEMEVAHPNSDAGEDINDIDPGDTGWYCRYKSEGLGSDWLPGAAEFLPKIIFDFDDDWLCLKATNLDEVSIDRGGDPVDNLAEGEEETTNEAEPDIFLPDSGLNAGDAGDDWQIREFLLVCIPAGNLVASIDWVIWQDQEESGEEQQVRAQRQIQDFYRTAYTWPGC